MPSCVCRPKTFGVDETVVSVRSFDRNRIFPFPHTLGPSRTDPFLLVGIVYRAASLVVSAAEEADTVPPPNAEKFSFDAQVDKMLHIVVNSLYQHNEVFLRELISNASDALDKIRYLLLSEPDKYKTAGADVPLEVKIEYDAEAQTLTIRDTGVGMTKEEMIQNLGTVARSGTTKFVEMLKETGNADSTISQIGQFGVGFYSAFLVADRVTVTSKSPLDPVQHVWESKNGAGDFLVYNDPRGNTLERGTEITLHLKDEAIEFNDPQRLRQLTKHYSEFVIYPISLRTTTTMEVEVDDEEEDEPKDVKEKGDDDLEIEDDVDKPKTTKEVTTHTWEQLNTNQAIWTREKEEIESEEYKAFFNVLMGDEDQEPETWVHFNAEGNINFKSILYLPTEVPSNYRFGNIEVVPGSMRLYVRKVLIGDSFSLLPKYLQFIRGMVDSDDLPLNVNRETLQENKILQVIRKKVVRKAIDLISSFAKDSEAESSGEAEIGADGSVDATNVTTPKYHTWYKKFSPNIKLGVIEDDANRAKLLKLLRYHTSKSTKKLVSLNDYIKNMKEWQDEIYVIGGTSIEELEKSPFLEIFREKDLEVIFLTDPVDEYLITHVREFDGKRFVQASSENVKFKDEDEDLLKRREKVYREKFKPLTKWLRTVYHGSVLRVQVAKRNLGTVPAIVTSSDFGNSANMERILRAQAFQHGIDPSSMMAMKVLEINPRHPIILKLLEGCPPEKTEEGEEEQPVPESTVDVAWAIHDMAMLNGGFPVNNPVDHNRLVTKMLQHLLGLESLELEPEINPPVEEEEPPNIDIKTKMSGINAEDFSTNLNDLDLDDLDLDSLGINMDDLMMK